MKQVFQRPALGMAKRIANSVAVTALLLIVSPIILTSMTLILISSFLKVLAFALVADTEKVRELLRFQDV